MFRVLFLSLLVSLPALAQDTATVRVSYVRDPVDKSYRKMIRGMERFERERATHAPNAALRFRLLPRLPNVRLDGVALRIASENGSIAVPLDADFSFTLPRNDAALRDDAAVVANRKSTSMTWRAWVQTPGLPPGTRRLGDLRLECKVGMDARLVSNTSPMFSWLTDALTSTEAICGKPDGNYLFFAEQPLFGVRLRAGERSAALPFKMLYAGGKLNRADLAYCDCQVLLDRTYYAPIWDLSWPDDTLLEFEPMTHSPQLNLDDIPTVSGPAHTVLFDSGLKAAMVKSNEGSELVILFDQNGRIVRTRRSAPLGL
jgi:hypothetical protein